MNPPTHDPVRAGNPGPGAAAVSPPRSGEGVLASLPPSPGVAPALGGAPSPADRPGAADGSTGRGSGRRGARLVGLLFSLVSMVTLLVLVLYPLAAILLQSVLPDLFGVPARLTLSLSTFGVAFSRPELYGAMLNTLWLGVAVAIFATLLGALLAVLVERTDLPGRRLVGGMVWVTLFTPSYLVALAWEVLYARGGLIDAGVVPLPDGVVNTIFSPVGLTILQILRLFPFAYLAVGAALRGLGSEYDEAARMVGARTLRRWLRINGRLLLPALFAGGLIIFAETISDYGTASTIAQQAGFNLVTYELYTALNNEPVDFALAATLSLILIVSIAAALVLQARLVRARSFQVITGRTRRAYPARLGPWRYPLLLLVALLFVVALLLPLAADILVSFLHNVVNGLGAANFTLSNYQQALSSSGDDLPALERSFVLAVATATIAALLGAAVAFVIERTRIPGRGFLRLVTIVTLAIPGIVLAVGYIFAWNQRWMSTAFGATPYGTIGLLLAAYVAGALPFSARLAGGSLAQVGDHLLEAARLAGAGVFGTFTRIVLPVVATALLSTWMLVFTGTIFELPASELLQPPGQPPLSVRINYWFNNLEFGPGTAITMLALLLVVVAALAIALAARLLRPRGRGRANAGRGL